MEICGVAGCILGQRTDSCPGCSADHVDLSEAGIAAACGVAASRCQVTVQQVIQQHFVVEPALEDPDAAENYY
jgi:hypothetical protein